MKKLLLFLFTILFTSAALFSQIVLTYEFGPTSLSPAISFNGAPGDAEIVSHITITNSGSENLNIMVAREQLYMVDTARSRFCWAGMCYSFETDTSLASMALAPDESTNEFSGHYEPKATEGVSQVRYTFYDEDNPTIFASVIVLYNSLFFITCEAGDSISEHARQLNGTVDIPLHGVIKVHNHSAGPLSLVAFKQPVYLVNNSTNWFWFGGDEYAFGTDTSDLVTIESNTTDESFEMFYDADGYEGVSQMVYVFLDPANSGNYALYWLHFNAESTGIDAEILESTTFSAAYPNPAEHFVSFDYDIPNEVNRAEIFITNLLGAVVYEGTLSGLNGTERIDVSNFTEGIYFATLKLDNHIASSQKILVQ